MCQHCGPFEEGAGWAGTKVSGEKVPAIVKMREGQCLHPGGDSRKGKKMINLEVVTRSGNRDF